MMQTWRQPVCAMAQLVGRPDLVEALPGRAQGVRMVPGSQWVVRHLEVEADSDLLPTPVNVAPQAHRTWPDPGDAAPDGCNDHPV